MNMLQALERNGRVSVEVHAGYTEYRKHIKKLVEEAESINWKLPDRFAKMLTAAEDDVAIRDETIARIEREYQ